MKARESFRRQRAAGIRRSRRRSSSERAHSVLSQNLLHVELLSVTQRLVLPVTPNEKIDALKCVLHEIDLHAPPQALTTRSISTQAPSGSAAAAIVVRAGKG